MKGCKDRAGEADVIWNLCTHLILNIVIQRLFYLLNHIYLLACDNSPKWITPIETILHHSKHIPSRRGERQQKYRENLFLCSDAELFTEGTEPGNRLKHQSPCRNTDHMRYSVQCSIYSCSMSLVFMMYLCVSVSKPGGSSLYWSSMQSTKFRDQSPYQSIP